MSVRGRRYIRASHVNPGVYRESSVIDRPIPLHYFAMLVNQQKIGYADVRKVHAERIHPKTVRPLRITCGYMARDPFTEAKLCEEAKGRGQTLFSMRPFFCDCLEDRRLRGLRDLHCS